MFSQEAAEVFDKGLCKSSLSFRGKSHVVGNLRNCVDGGLK